MREKTNLFQVNGMPLLVPDAQVGMSYEDLDSADSGRDESGVMHRIPVRYKVASWNFTYDHLTEEERQYMESIFPDSPDFSFTHPSRQDSSVPEVSRAYRSKCAISWQNARTGLWNNYGFSVIMC